MTGRSSTPRSSTTPIIMNIAAMKNIWPLTLFFSEKKSPTGKENLLFIWLTVARIVRANGCEPPFIICFLLGYIAFLLEKEKIVLRRVAKSITSLFYLYTCRGTRTHNNLQ